MYSEIMSVIFIIITGLIEKLMISQIICNQHLLLPDFVCVLFLVVLQPEAIYLFAY